MTNANINEESHQINEVSRFILLLLGAKGGIPIPGPLWLQKEMLLIQDAIPSLADELDFEPYLMGPHSEIVANEAEELRKSSLIKTEGGKTSLTEKGKLLVEDLLRQADKKELEKIEELKDFVNDLPKDELLAFIYFAYPTDEIETDAIKNESFEYQDLLPKRKKLARSLYMKGKISAHRAAQVAGDDLETFVEYLKNPDNSFRG